MDVLRYQRVLWLVAVFGFLAHASPALAQDLSNDPRLGDVWKKSQVLKDQPSADTAPIVFSIAGVHYKVPRNYISHMDNYKGGPQELVTFKVTFPGFDPLTDKTRQCLTQPQAHWPPGCIPLEFWIDGQGKGMPPLSDKRVFTNSLDLFPDKTPKQGPSGLDVYRNGADKTPLELYTKKTSTHLLVILCRYYEMSTRTVGLCTNYGSPLSNGNGLSYRLDIEQIENAEKMDAGMRSLIDSFTLNGDKP